MPDAQVQRGKLLNAKCTMDLARERLAPYQLRQHSFQVHKDTRNFFHRKIGFKLCNSWEMSGFPLIKKLCSLCTSTLKFMGAQIEDR